jgi:hypothetical protein
MVGGVLAAVVLPPLLTTPADPLSSAVAVLALAVAAVLGLGVRWVSRPAGTDGSARASDDGPMLVLSGRATDPTHHPVRPRAPGLA